MNRNNVILTVCILVAFTVLIVADYNKLMRPAEAVKIPLHRWRATELGYCNADNVTPCIVSFSRADDGTMLVNILVPAEYPEFFLVVARGDEEIGYTCNRNEDVPTTVYCTGAEILPGEKLKFTLISIQQSYILAEGNFAIIGLLLATPGTEPTIITPAVTEPPATEAPIFTDYFFPTATPTALVLEPFPTATEPSYPGPSYPTP